jgi:asparagine synthase (glutamine-hydrolysing)
VKVALSGQGADELLAGYRKHQIAWVGDRAARLPLSLRRQLAAPARSSEALSRGVVALATDDPTTRYLAMSRVVDSNHRSALYSTGLGDHEVEEEIADVVRQRLAVNGKSIFEQVLDLDMKLALVDNMLLYFDKMSMATSLEVRVPFMDHDVVAFCAALPTSRRMSLRHGLRGKEILRRVSQGLVGAETIAKKKRGFFRSAASSWIRAHHAGLVREILLDQRTLERGLYRPDGIKALFEPNGRGWFRKDEMLLALLLLEKWQRLFVDGDQPSHD